MFELIIKHICIQVGSYSSTKPYLQYKYKIVYINKINYIITIIIFIIWNRIDDGYKL